MKLRNKKTGEVVDLSIFGITLNIRKEEQPTYHSIEQLCEDWEDVKEPLIKDEKIRKAVRAWAEANEVEEVAVLAHLVWGENNTEIAKSGNASLRIVFSGDLGIKMWTGVITELCGEEEE